MKKKPRNEKDQLIFDAHRAIAEAVEDWKTPDSPEGFAFAMKGLMVVRDRMAAHLGLPTTPDTPTP